jgi:hypothetical protein
MTATDPSDGAQLLDDLHALLTRYVVLPSPAATDAVVLWIAATHAIDSIAHATRLVIKSPEKRCGKTRLLDILEGTVRAPIATISASVAALFRLLDKEPRTILLDEADTVFGSRKVAEQNEDLRGLLNAGFARGKTALRCVGPMQTPTEFQTFAMAARAGIGDMPDTIEDRAVIVTMRRRAPGETVQPFRERRDRPELDEVRSRLVEWIATVESDLADAEPTMPVEDRAADTWEPLVAVADAAGGHWPARARTACMVMVAAIEDESAEASLGTRLLSDVRDVLTEPLSSERLVVALRSVADAPWEAFGLDQRGLARRLKGYGITPKPLPRRRDELQVRGYVLEQFADAFARYVPAPGTDVSPTVTPSHQEQTRRSEPESRVTVPNRVTDASVTPNLAVTQESASDLGKHPACDGVTPRDGMPPCATCGEPMVDLHDGFTTHPGCEVA